MDTKTPDANWEPPHRKNPEGTGDPLEEFDYINSDGTVNINRPSAILIRLRDRFLALEGKSMIAERITPPESISRQVE